MRDNGPDSSSTDGIWSWTEVEISKLYKKRTTPSQFRRGALLTKMGEHNSGLQRWEGAQLLVYRYEREKLPNSKDEHNSRLIQKLQSTTLANTSKWGSTELALLTWQSTTLDLSIRRSITQTILQDGKNYPIHRIEHNSLIDVEMEEHNSAHTPNEGWGPINMAEHNSGTIQQEGA